MRKSHIAAGVIGGLALVAFASACGGDDDKKSNTPAPRATTAATSAATKPAAAATSAATKASSGAEPTKRNEVDALTVAAKDFSFSVNLTSLHSGPPGVDVNFSNEGGTTHTVAFYADADFKTKIAESQPVAAGASSAFPFIPPDGSTKVFYRCEIHPTQMKGELPVQ